MTAARTARADVVVILYRVVCPVRGVVAERLRFQEAEALARVIPGGKLAF